MRHLIFLAGVAMLISGTAMAQDNWSQDYLGNSQNWGGYENNIQPYALEGYTGEAPLGYGNDNSYVPQPPQPDLNNPYIQERLHPTPPPTCYSTWQGPYWVTRCY